MNGGYSLSDLMVNGVTTATYVLDKETCKGKHHYLGIFDTEQEAVEVFNKKAATARGFAFVALLLFLETIDFGFGVGWGEWKNVPDTL